MRLRRTECFLERRESKQVDARLSCIERWRLVAKLSRLIYHKSVKLYSTIVGNIIVLGVIQMYVLEIGQSVCASQ